MAYAVAGMRRQRVWIERVKRIKKSAVWSRNGPLHHNPGAKRSRPAIDAGFGLRLRV
jgi:hypothetical protein